MSRETLKNFLNLKGLGTDSISIGYNKQGEVSREQEFDLGKDLNSGEDLLNLPDETSGLLGDYVNFITQNAQHVFGINPGNEEAASSNRGDALVLAEEQGATNVFVSQGTEAANLLNQNSNSQYFEGSGTPLNDMVDKTGDTSNSHNLLSDIEGSRLSKYNKTLVNQQGEDNVVTNAVSKVLFSNNRFANTSNTTAFATKGSQISDFEGGETDEGTITSQNLFGNFDMEGSKFTLEQLKDVGVSLLYKASGYDTGDQPGLSEDINDLHDKILAEEVSNSQIGDDGYNKIQSKRVRSKFAKGAPESLSGNSTRSDRGDYFPNDPNSRSADVFGTSYNTSVHFHGRGRKILKLKAAIACLALKKVTKDFVDKISEFIKFKDLKTLQETSEERATLDKTYDGPGPHPLGSFKQLNSFEFDIFKKLILVRTDYPYPACFEKGVEVFFGSEDDVEKMRDHDHLSQAPGYWLSIATSILKSADQLSNAFEGLESFESESVDKITYLFEIVKSNKLIQFANAAATVGDIYFKTSGGMFAKNKNSNRPYDVDSLPSGPATRVGKSRDSGGTSPLALAWRQNSVPSMYLLPKNVVKASVDLNNIFDGASPVRGHLTSVLIKNTYMDSDLGGSNNRIPNDVVKRLENKLEAEYVPFYIQDLRTNEVISFHAFLSDLSDNIKADYSPVTGYGRLDPVQVYKSTTRTVGVSFILYATSKEDFDDMWYKINKLTTLLYPQWTQGTHLTSTGTDRFIQPFSQVIGASPIVRVRVGDVIKSNYSRFNLARMFGIGDEGINPMTDTELQKTGEAAGNKTQIAAGNTEKASKSKMQKVGNFLSDILLNAFYILTDTPLKMISVNGKDRRGRQKAIAGRNFISNALVNGFVNPLGAGLVLRALTDPNTRTTVQPVSPNVASTAEALASGLLNAAAETNNHTSLGYIPYVSRAFLKSNMVRGYRASDGSVIRIDRPLRVLVLPPLPYEDVDNANNQFVINENFKKDETFDNVPKRTRYLVKVIDPAAPFEIFMTDLEADFQNLMPDPRDVFTTSGLGIALSGAQPRAFADFAVGLVEDVAQAAGVGAETVDMLKDLYATEAEKFMQPENNPFTRALESTAGRGLAGTIDGFSFKWYNSDFTWETDYNSRAPRGVEISFNLNVIHDLPPGLDHSGYNKAPLYNVGGIMKEIVGDSRNDDAGAEFEYRRNGVDVYTKTGGTQKG